jgi:glycerol-3-phosphate acyltransferase PlsY
METAWPILVSILIGYLLGAIPFGVLIPRLRGVDIMGVGTGNPGAANVYRKIGRRYGLLVGAADMAKAALAVLIARWLGLSAALALAAGGAAVLGHWYSPFLRFKGGAGLAPAVGAAAGVMPIEAVIGVAVTLVMIAWRRNTGLAAMVGYVVAIPVGAVLGRPVAVLLGVLALAVVVSTRSVLRDYRAARGRESEGGSAG